MQIESIRALIFDRHDVILIAKTSFGKSMIPQSVLYSLGYYLASLEQSVVGCSYHGVASVMAVN